VESLLLRYGHFLLFAGVMVEGEAFLLAAAFLAHRGLFHLWAVIATAVAANTTADLLYYLAARARGRAWLERRFGANPRYARLVAAMERHGRFLLLVSRFAFGFRVLIPAACGVFGMPLLAFSLINVAASVLWAVPIALAGYYGGGVLEALLVDVHRYEAWVAVGLVAVGLVLTAGRQLRHAMPVHGLRVADWQAVVPFVMGLMGLLNLASAIVPHSPAALAALEGWLPLEVTQRSRPLMLFAGIALLQVTRNLARRKQLAWWVATAALAVSLASHLGRGLDLHHSLIAALLLAYLLVFRRRFNARSDPASLRLALAMLPVLMLAVYVYGAVGLSHLATEYAWDTGATPASEAFRSGILILEPGVDPRTEHAARFLGSLQIAGWIARFYGLFLLLRPVILRARQEAPEEDVARVFALHARHHLAAFAVQQDKHHLLVAEGRAFVGYAVRRSVAFSVGDPLAAPEDLQRATRGFLDHCQRHGWRPCLYEAAEENLGVYRALGLRALKMAEEAVIDLSTWNLAGGKRATLRAMVSKTRKLGLTVRRYERPLAPDPALDEELEEISEEWLAEKRLGELGFTMNRFSLEALDAVPVFVCESAGRVLAFCSFLPYRAGRAVVLDLLRKRRDTVSGTMDLLLAEALTQLAASGFEEASLANAPLANVGEPRSPLDKGVALLFENLNSFYGYKNLFQFKKKFAPRWEGRYLVYPSGAQLPQIALAMASVHGSAGLLRTLLRR
jgi:phosphatidylglycerol lysyltransferase